MDIVGAWVASTFTTSPIRATLARWGFVKGGTHVVSGQAKEAGLISAGEHLTKKADLHTTCSRIRSSQSKDLLIGKLTG